MLGRTIGKYRVVEKIGRGGMGTVYKAIDETLDREVAIKALNRDLGENEVVRRFRAEAMTLARLNHPGIATIYELLRVEDELLMVMEFVRGETFDRIVERVGPLAPARAASLVAQVLDALGHAHRVGIVHRDLKPANLMLTQYGAIKIMDFGIARVLGTEHLTSDGLMMGTPAYMAPEQVLATDIDARADLYSIGVVLYRLLSGSLPFQADTAIAMAHKQVKDPPTPLRQHRAELPDWCETVLARALAKSPADRYQTAEDFRDALVTLGASLVPTTTRTESLEITLAPDQVSAAGMATPVVTDATLPPPAPAPPPVAAIREGSGPVAQSEAPVRAETQLPNRVEPASPAPKTSDGSTTVILQKRHIALAAGLFALLVVVFGILAALVVQKTGPESGASAEAQPPAPSSSSEAPTAPSSEPTATAAVEPAADPAPPPVAATAAPTPTPASTAPAAPKPAVAKPSPSPRDPVKTAAGAATGPTATAPPGAAKEPAPAGAEATSPSSSPAASPAPAASARDASLPPLTVTDLRIVVADDGRLRERDAVMTFAAGNLTIADRNGAVVHTVPYSGILGVSYSRSRQPLWQSPGGPAPVLKVGGGAFGIFRSEPNWYSVRTKDVFLVLRVEPKHLRTLPTAFSDRAGVTVQVVRPPR
jgi:serine/threonine-protein kinase